jgi:integrase/recombinase XerD
LPQTNPTAAKRVEDAAKGLADSYRGRLSKLPLEQTITICDYILAMGSEIKLSNQYRESILNTLISLAFATDVSKSKPFKKFTRADAIAYLNHFKKDESDDPTHKWIGSYNTSLVNLVRFFRWLYSPDIESKERPKPKVVQNLAGLRRREISGYKPSDMWDADDNLVFLRYCPSPRDRVYHAIEADTGARPHELLGLKIKDIPPICRHNARHST